MFDKGFMFHKLPMFDKIKQHWRRRKTDAQPIDTTVTLKTKYLIENVKNYASFNRKLALLALLTAILTCVPIFGTSMPTIAGAISSGFSGTNVLENLSTFPWLDAVLIGVSMLTLILAVYALVRLFALYNPIKFVNRMVAEQYDTQEYTAVFIIKRMVDNTPKVLVYKSQSWNSFFLPYCHYDPEDRSKNNADFLNNITLAIADQLEVNPTEIQVHDSFTKNDYVAIKGKPNHTGMLRINYRFYYITFAAPYVANKFLTQNASHFTWKSKYELGKDVDTQLNNGDVLQIMDELSLITQSKSAFSEIRPTGFDIGTAYRIIWNITDVCDFNCPICATNSSCANQEKCDKATKFVILKNLSTISGHLEALDISGGDPLKDAENREVIRQANQILAYTRITVTTTGKALQNVPFDEIIQTVKNCEVTYDTPYNVCNTDLQNYREYEYNRNNYMALERFGLSGVKINIRVNIPLLPAVACDSNLISTLLEQVYLINPASVKFIRLMPVGRCKIENTNTLENAKKYLTDVENILSEKSYRFETAPNCSLGVKIKKRSGQKDFCRKCEMLTHKLGIDCRGRVYSCIWGAYIEAFCDDDKYLENPFYLGDLTKNTMYEILTDAKTQKILQKLNECDWTKTQGCRVCAYASALETNKDMLAKDGDQYEKRMKNFERMMEAPDNGNEIISSVFDIN